MDRIWASEYFKEVSSKRLVLLLLYQFTSENCKFFTLWGLKLLTYFHLN